VQLAVTGVHELSEAMWPALQPGARWLTFGPIGETSFFFFNRDSRAASLLVPCGNGMAARGRVAEKVPDAAEARGINGSDATARFGFRFGLYLQWCRILIWPANALTPGTATTEARSIHRRKTVRAIPLPEISEANLHIYNAWTRAGLSCASLGSAAE